MIGLMNAKLNDNQEQMESWHDHVIYENIFEGVGIPSGKRVINASSLTFLTASGVEVNVRASAEYVELGFGTNKSDTLALIEPRACNRIRIVPASARRYA